MSAPGFWDNNDRAQKHITKVNGLKKAVLPVVESRKRVDDLDLMLDLIKPGPPPTPQENGRELDATVAKILP